MVVQKQYGTVLCNKAARLSKSSTNIYLACEPLAVRYFLFGNKWLYAFWGMYIV